MLKRDSDQYLEDSGRKHKDKDKKKRGRKPLNNKKSSKHSNS